MSRPLIPVDYLPHDEVKAPVKVRVGYRDGSHWLEAYTDEHAKAGLAYVEIERHVWEQWAAHCASARIWQAFCLSLGNEIYDKEHEGAAA